MRHSEDKALGVDVKLFKLHPNGRAVELPGEVVSVERSLGTLS